MIKEPYRNRRSFLVSFLSMLGIMIFFPNRLMARLGQPGVSADEIESVWTQNFVNKKSAIIVGQEYLRCFPEEANRTLLVKLLGAPLDKKRSRTLTADRDGARRLLQERIRNDFECSQTLRIQGWVLSRTEARLCGLAALQYKVQ